MISKTEVGARISSLRRKAALSQAAFSELLNVSPQAVSKWETGLSLVIPTPLQVIPTGNRKREASHTFPYAFLSPAVPRPSPYL